MGVMKIVAVEMKINRPIWGRFRGCNWQNLATVQIRRARERDIHQSSCVTRRVVTQSLTEDQHRRRSRCEGLMEACVKHTTGDVH